MHAAVTALGSCKSLRVEHDSLKSQFELEVSTCSFPHPPPPHCYHETDLKGIQ